MRVAGEDVHAFMRFVLGFQQVGIDAAAAINASGELIHSVIFGNAVGEGFVHGDDDGVNLLVGEVELQSFFEPGHLLEIELVRGGVIEIDEGHVRFDPVEVGRDFARVRIVAEALFL